jgi:large subunit ribosomal protein L14
VKEAAPDSAIKKGKVVRCVIVRMRKETRRQGWHLYPVRFQRRGADQRVGRAGGYARVRTGSARELRDKRFMKIVSLAPEVI